MAFSTFTSGGDFETYKSARGNQPLPESVQRGGQLLLMALMPRGTLQLDVPPDEYRVIDELHLHGRQVTISASGMAGSVLSPEETHYGLEFASSLAQQRIHPVEDVFGSHNQHFVPVELHTRIRDKGHVVYAPQNHVAFQPVGSTRTEEAVTALEQWAIHGRADPAVSFIAYSEDRSWEGIAEAATHLVLNRVTLLRLGMGARKFTAEPIVSPHVRALARSMGALLASAWKESYHEYSERLPEWVGSHECTIDSDTTYDIPYYQVSHDDFQLIQDRQLPASAPQLIPMFVK